MFSLKLRKGRKWVVAGLVLLALLPLVSLFNTLDLSSYVFDEGLDLKQRKLAKYRQKLLEKEGVERAFAGLRNTFKQAEAALLTGETPSLAAAEIQEIVTGITKAAGAQIKTVRILQPDRSGKGTYLAIPVEVTISSTMRELTQLLYKLDSSTKLLRIAKLTVRSSGRRGRGVGPVDITTTLTVEGFVKRMEI